MTAENPAGGPEPAKSQPGQGGALIERQETLPSTLLLNEPRPEEDEDGINLRDYWNIIVKRKWTVLTFFLITVTAVLTATFDLAEVEQLRNNWFVFRDRRPDLYGAITTLDGSAHQPA